MSYFYLGIDVSKGYADFVLLNANKNPVMEPFQLDDTAEGHSLLLYSESPLALSGKSHTT